MQKNAKVWTKLENTLNLVTSLFVKTAGGMLEETAGPKEFCYPSQ
jgi:hypothetical protein